jgi:hypothetical protein
LQQDRATGEPPWPTTLFCAAIDAVNRQWWAADSPAHDPRRRRTQGWHLQVAGRLLGVHPDLDRRTRERIATRLRVPTLTLRSAARTWASRWQAQGSAILAVLQALALDEALADRLLSAGMMADLWPRPQRWDAGRQTWVRARARSGGARQTAPKPAASRAPPPTTSRTPGHADAGVASVS